MRSAIASRAARGIARGLLVFGLSSGPVLVAQPSVVLAGEPSRAEQADQLFRRARGLMDELRYAEACPMLEQSYQLDPGAGTLLNLALCHEALNRTKTAYDEYKAVLDKAQADKRPDRERVARERMANLEPRIPTVIVRVAAADRDAALLVDGAKIEAGTAARLDPGHHELTASAPGRKPWSTSFDIGTGEHATLDVAPLAPEGACAPGAPCGAAAPPPTPVPPPASVAPSAAPTMVVAPTHPNPWRIAVLSVSAASLTASLATGIAAIVEHSKANGDCVPERGFCGSAAGIGSADTARTLAWVSTITLLVGVGAGLVGFLLIPAEVGGTRIEAGLGPTGTFLRGRW